ncbi:hypothetical protein J2X97_001632 [Epilithonimonas hungarica]|uniref:reverse transcriptase domain-containing protein n=1 Tax=Epilithonimonas hungarica TaxID=454006 RepID=UPI00277D7DA0|nr:reverse transcriptase domain-containing protein [Epilithonimonas hungarica]MDP9955995.1 hypothetical protein [Epilithonimonas hungarica]
MKTKDWFKIKRYPHIGFPVEGKMRSEWIEKYITDEKQIAKHGFLPFIHKTNYQRKFRKKYDDKNGIKIVSQGEETLITRYKKEKKREIFYASHIDALIYSFYASELNEKYEERISEYGINEVVNAYRSVPVNPDSVTSSNKCNVDFANDVFKYILDYDKEEFSVIAFDISSFFDNLDHKLLRDVWMEVLKVEILPADHFNVYKNITRFSFVDIVDIFMMFQNKIFTRNRDKEGKYLPIKRKYVAKIKFLKSQNAIAFCTKEEFFKNKNKLLKPSKTFKDKDGNILYKNFGIPQGSPISAVLANMYLLNFDRFINNTISKYGGIYRRYSDDMVVVCPLDKKEEISELIYNEIKNYKLEIQREKTQVFRFIKDNDRLICGQEFNEEINWSKNFVYLGFEFDGKYTTIKSGSISNYYRKMKRNIRRAKHYSKKDKNFKGEIFKRRLYKMFTYKGALRFKKYKWHSGQNKFIKSEDYNWGNFLSYAYKSSKIMVNNKIRGQVRNHWSKFHNELNR